MKSKDGLKATQRRVEEGMRIAVAVSGAPNMDAETARAIVAGIAMRWPQPRLEAYNRRDDVAWHPRDRKEVGGL